MESFTHKPEVIPEPLAVTMEFFEEVKVEAISNIKTKSVYAEFLEPSGNAVFYVLLNIAVVKIEFDKFEMTFPALIPEIVVIRGPSVTEMEPVFIFAFPAVCTNILKSPEFSSDMVKNTVYNNTDAVFMQSIADLLKIGICTEPAVYLGIIDSIITMSYGFEYRTEIYGIEAKLLYAGISSITERMRLTGSLVKSLGSSAPQ